MSDTASVINLDHVNRCSGNIFVNATAAVSGGAYSILGQFLETVPAYDPLNRYYVFCSTDLTRFKRDNICFVQNKPKSWLKRIVWDWVGLRRWANKNTIRPRLIVSFQNTGVGFDGDVPQLIYFHNQLVLATFKWSVFKGNERLFYFYAKVYPIIVKYSLRSNTAVVVQSKSVKSDFIKKFHINPERVHIIRPAIQKVKIDEVQTISFKDDKYHMFYPAPAHLFKNHIIIVNAISRLKIENPETVDRMAIHLTIEKNTGAAFAGMIKEKGLEKCFSFEGVLPYEKVLSFYKSVDLMLFPSFVETFGLPLVEAAAFGLPILVSDLPYSREALGDYPGAKYLPSNSDCAWSQMITASMDRRKRFCCYDTIKLNDNPWITFYELMKKISNTTIP